MNSTSAAISIAYMTSLDPNSNFVSHFQPQIWNVTVGQFYDPSKTKTPLFHFCFSNQQKIKGIHESCQKIFTAIGNQDTKALSELLKDLTDNFQQTAVVNFVVKQFVIKGPVTIRPLSAAALLGSQEMVKALVSKASPNTLKSYLKDFLPYYKSCHAIILQHIENSTDLAAANDAMQHLLKMINDLALGIANAINNPVAARLANYNYNNFTPLAIERMMEIHTIFNNFFTKRKAMLTAHIPVAALVKLIEDYGL